MEIRCSGLARPMVCAGYVFLDLPVSPTNEAAEAGTAAGEYLERMLLNKPLSEVASNGVFIDDDMRFYTKDVYDNIMSRVAPISKVLCEKRIDWQTRSGIWIRGQYDVSFVDNQGRLCVEDLKYGFNIVEPFENWQLLGYAIGEVIRRGEAFNEISLKIHQPRAHHEDGPTREWLISYETLIEYKEKIETRMQEIANGRRDLQTSDKCKYCMGAQEACPAFNRLVNRSLDIVTEFYQDSMSNDEVSRYLDHINKALEVLKIKKDSLTDLGVNRIKAGEIIPGYVQSEKYGNREWNNGVSPKSIKMMTGVNIIEEKIMSPAKAEKLGVDKQLIKQLCKKKFLGTKLEKKDSTEIGNKIFGTIKPN